ncbi:MAG: long-chain fatty acid--CoA ligase [Ktedonobacterales bacterium]|nr:long-chain fatty acid--CoA ligase [Ktedonobacterales bacterium]
METEINLAQLFRNRAATYGDAIRWRQKRLGKEYKATWRENQALVNSFISGLDALGAAPGDIIAILSETRWEWMVADWAIVGLGAATVTVYPSNLPPTVSFILNDSGARYIFVENRAQYEKLSSIRHELANIRKVILFDDAEQVAGDDWVMSFEALRRMSKRTPVEEDAFAAQHAALIRPEHLVTLVYTSGTTGMPKGVPLTHGNFMAELVGVRTMLDTIKPGQVDLLFLPLAHVFARDEHFSGYDRGLHTVIAESLDDLAAEMRAVKPDLLFSVPRIYEKAYATVTARVAAGSKAQRRIFGWATRVGLEVSQRRQRGARIPAGLRVRYRLADRLVFHKIREALGGRLQFAVTAAAPLETSILEFFDAAGIVLLEGWGMTETSAGFTLNQVGRQRLGTVGKPFPGHEAQLAPDGELLVRGPCIFAGYHNNPQANAESFDPGGWFHTGDIATIDADGFVRIVDRKKDLIITAAGKNIAPQSVENVLKTIPTVSQAVVYGDRKPYLVALLTLDPLAVGAWAGENGVTYSDVREVYTHPRYRAFLDERVAQANRQLASYETVKYYDVLAEDFTVENDLLTPTLKIRRRQIYTRYHDRFEALYRPAPAEISHRANT